MKIYRQIGLVVITLLFCHQSFAETSPFSCGKKELLLQKVNDAILAKGPTGDDSLQSLQQKYDKEMANFVILQGIKQIRLDYLKATNIEVSTNSNIDDIVSKLNSYSDAVGSFALIEDTINSLIEKNKEKNPTAPLTFADLTPEKFTKLCADQAATTAWCKKGDSAKQLFSDFMIAYNEATKGGTTLENIEKLKQYKKILEDGITGDPAYTVNLESVYGKSVILSTDFDEMKARLTSPEGMGSVNTCKNGDSDQCERLKNEIINPFIDKVKKFQHDAHLEGSDIQLDSLRDLVSNLTPTTKVTKEDFQLDSKEQKKILKSYEQIKNLAKAHGTTGLPEFSEGDDSLYAKMVDRLQTIEMFKIPDCKGSTDMTAIHTLKNCFDKIDTKEMQKIIDKEIQTSSDNLNNLTKSISAIKNDPKSRELFDLQAQLGRVVLQECGGTDAEISSIDASCESCYIDSILPKDQRGLILSSGKAVVTLDPTLLKDSVTDSEKSSLFYKLCNDKKFKGDIAVECNISATNTAVKAIYKDRVYNPKTKQLEDDSQQFWGNTFKSAIISGGQFGIFAMQSQMAVNNTIFSTHMYNNAMTIRNQNILTASAYNNYYFNAIGSSNCYSIFSLGCVYSSSSILSY